MTQRVQWSAPRRMRRPTSCRRRRQRLPLDRSGSPRDHGPYGVCLGRRRIPARACTHPHPSTAHRLRRRTPAVRAAHPRPPEGPNSGHSAECGLAPPGPAAHTRPSGSRGPPLGRRGAARSTTTPPRRRASARTGNGRRGPPPPSRVPVATRQGRPLGPPNNAFDPSLQGAYVQAPQDKRRALQHLDPSDGALPSRLHHWRQVLAATPSQCLYVTF